MKLQKVPLALVKVPLVRVTAVYSEETQQLLHQTVERLGILNPVILTKDGDDLWVVDGLHRVEEALAAGADTIDAVVYSGSTQDNLVMNLVLNKVRGKTKASEMVAVIGELIHTHGLDSEQIGELTGLSREYVEKLWQLSEASEGVREALDQEWLGVGVAHEISRLPTHQQQDYLIGLQGIYKWSIKDARDYVNQVLLRMGEPVPAPPQPRVYQPGKAACEGCRQETEGRYLRAVMLCPTCLGQVWERGKEAGSAVTSQETSSG